MQVGNVVQFLEKLTNMIFHLFCKKKSCHGKMAVTFAYELGLKSFLYEKSSTRKVTSEFNWGNFVEDFQNPQKPNRKKDTGLLRSRGGKMEKKFKLSNGAPFARCATSNRKKNWFRIFFWKKCSKYDT